jgi:hypothetical protein
MIPANLLKTNAKFFVHDYVKNARPTSQRLAITAQHCCSIEFDENLLAPDGISETAA